MREVIRAQVMKRLRVSLRGFLAFGAAIGFLLFAYSFDLPEYSDPERADALQSANWTIAPDLHAFTQDWFRQMDEVRTAKWDIQNFGVGFFSLSMSLLLAALAFRIDAATQLRTVKTPATVRGFLIPGAIAWVVTTLSYVYVLFRDLSRGYYPTWADSVAIPLAAVPVPLILLPIPLILGWLTVRKAALPVNVWIWNRSRPIRSWVWAILFGTLCLLLTLLLIDAVFNGDFILVPLVLLALYLCLSARAAVTA